MCKIPASVQYEAPDFTATAVINGEFKDINLKRFIDNKYTILFFYPLDFTFGKWSVGCVASVIDAVCMCG